MKDNKGIQQKLLEKRIMAILIGWGSVGIIYFLTTILEGPGQVMYESFIDKKIPFISSWIWCYLSFFIYIPVCFFIVPLKRLSQIKYLFIFSGIIAGIIFMLYPTTQIYPQIVGDNWADKACLFLIKMDSQNCVPSLHACLVFIGFILVYDKKHIFRSFGMILWGLAIIISIIIVRRHLFLDLITGILLGFVGIMLYWFYIRHITKKEKYF